MSRAAALPQRQNLFASLGLIFFSPARGSGREEGGRPAGFMMPGGLGASTGSCSCCLEAFPPPSPPQLGAGQPGNCSSQLDTCGGAGGKPLWSLYARPYQRIALSPDLCRGLWCLEGISEPGAEVQEKAKPCLSKESLKGGEGLTYWALESDAVGGASAPALLG